MNFIMFGKAPIFNIKTVLASCHHSIYKRSSAPASPASTGEHKQFVHWWCCRARWAGAHQDQPIDSAQAQPTTRTKTQPNNLFKATIPIFWKGNYDTNILPPIQV